MIKTMNKSPEENQLQPDLQPLGERCPAARDNPTDCPLSQVRRLPVKQRQAWLSTLSDADARYLAAYHQVCLSIKMEAEPVCFEVKLRQLPVNKRR
jgi:hypothetical protein